MKSVFNNSRLSTFSLLLLLFMFVVYWAIRFTNLSQAVQRVKSAGDTSAYVRIAKEPFWDIEFLAAARPLVFPLLIKMADGDLERVAWVQGIFSMISWGTLAAAVAYSLRIYFLRWISFGLILVLSLFQYIIAWDSVILTESLALSFMSLFIAGWLWLARGWHWGKVILIFVIAFLWAFTRDTNAWLVLMIAAFILVLVAFRYLDKRYILFPAVFAVIFLLSNTSADLGARWVFPFQNVLARRILPDESATAFFVDTCGMPISTALTRLTGEWSSGQDRAFYEDPELEEYRAWLSHSGKSCYMKWLVLHPLRSVQNAFVEFDILIGMQDIQSFLFSKRFSPILPGRAERVLFPDRFLLLFSLIIFVLMVIAFFNKAWMTNKAWWVAIGLNLLLLPHYFLVWHGDVMGIQRHVMIASAQFYFGVWIVMLLTLDDFLSRNLLRKV